MNALTQFSESLAAVVTRLSPAIVRIDANGDTATGIAWGDGRVVTTEAALAEADQLTVTGADGAEAPASVVGSDAGTGLVLLNVPTLKATRPELANLDTLAVGHLAIALARPGRSVRARLGIVSALGGPFRTHAGARIDRAIETSLSLGWEFSGAALVDSEGRLVGVQTRRGRRRDGFVLPATTIDRVVGTIASGKGAARGYLGIATFPAHLPAALRAQSGRDSGLLVVSVEDDSPAANAGIALGDVLLDLGGKPVAAVGDLFEILADAPSGTEVPARVARAGAMRDARITVGTRPA